MDPIFNFMCRLSIFIQKLLFNGNTQIVSYLENLKMLYESFKAEVEEFEKRKEYLDLNGYEDALEREMILQEEISINVMRSTYIRHEEYLSFIKSIIKSVEIVTIKNKTEFNSDASEYIFFLNSRYFTYHGFNTNTIIKHLKGETRQNSEVSIKVDINIDVLFGEVSKSEEVAESISKKCKLKKTYFICNPIGLYLGDNEKNAVIEKAPYDSFHSKLIFLMKFYSSVKIKLIVRQYIEKIGLSLFDWKLVRNIGNDIFYSILLAILVNLSMIMSINNSVVGFSDGSEYTSVTSKYGVWIVFFFGSLHQLYLIITLFRIRFTISIREKALAEESSLKGILGNLNQNFDEDEVNENENFYEKFEGKDNNIQSVKQAGLEKLLNDTSITVGDLYSSTQQIFGNSCKGFIKYIYFEDAELIYFNFIVGLIALMYPQFQFLFALQLFSILFYVPTMKIAITSVIIRQRQFYSAFLFLFFITFFFSSIAYIFFKNSYFNEETRINSCSTLFACLLHFMNVGVRQSLSFNFSIKSISTASYWPEFILDWSFYIINIVILLNVINGIIVDTFQEMRENEIKKSDFKKNNCFICSLNRTMFDLQGLSYSKHTNEAHDVLNYYHYFIMLELKSNDELTFEEEIILKCIAKNKFDFLPIQQTMK